MRWNKLPDKQPPFEQNLVVWRILPMNPNGHDTEFLDCWRPALLKEITETPQGKKYVFEDLMVEATIDDATHWAIPTKPKE